MTADTYRGMQQPAPAEYEALHEAMQWHRPACRGDDRFTADLAPLDGLREICTGCPLRQPCGDYAAAARPAGGVWAGRRYGNPNSGRIGRPRKEQAA